MYKTRFAPSPTGLIHFGNLRTALFNYLIAMHSKGEFLLRIEDTDFQRSKEEYVTQLLSDLKWLGLNYNDGPYKQSERFEIYEKYYQELKNKGLTFPCFCSEEKLKITRKVQLSQGLPPRYPGTCKHLSALEIEKKIAAGEKYSLRFKVSDNETVLFNDLLKGKLQFKTYDIGDFIIKKTDGTPSFMFCNAIDDSLMAVNLVIRGEDHLTNTPRQLLILSALGLKKPEYCHITLIVGSDNAPLSKRHGSMSVKELHEKGYLPIAILNYLARLGHSYSENKLLSLDELANNFTITNLAKAPARFDFNQLLFWQKEAMLQASSNDIEWLLEKSSITIPNSKKDDFISLVKNNCLLKKDIEALANVVFAETILYSQDVIEIVENAGKEFYQEAIKALQANDFNLKPSLEQIKSTLGVKGKQLFMPFRAGLTGEAHGPELDKIVMLMDNDLIIDRFKRLL